MKKERLYILVYVDKSKILIRNLQDITSYKPTENDMFIYIRDELFFGDNGILELSEYYNITNLEDFVDENLKKVFFTLYLIDLNYHNFIKTTNDNELYHDLIDLYSYFNELTLNISLEDFINSSHYKDFQLSLEEDK
jgi:23S rRNA maturation-related 3'-5' exoribonuclease YhaM